MLRSDSRMTREPGLILWWPGVITARYWMLSKGYQAPWLIPILKISNMLVFIKSLREWS